MTRSKRQTSKTGITTATSEKDDKRKARKQVRKRNKIELSSGKELSDRRVITEVWCFAKDGKQYFDLKMQPKLMRK